MLVLPPGAYGAANSAAGAASTSVRTECLLTSSLDGTLRLWDVSADLMSLEVCISAPRRRGGGCGGVLGTKNYIAFGRSTWCSRVTAVATCPANVVENCETTGATRSCARFVSATGKSHANGGSGRGSLFDVLVFSEVFVHFKQSFLFLAVLVSPCTI